MTDNIETITTEETSTFKWGLNEWILTISVFMIFINSMMPWYTWSKNLLFYNWPFFFGIYYYAAYQRQLIRQPRYINIYLLCMVVFLIYTLLFEKLSLNGSIGKVLQIAAIGAIAMQRQEVKVGLVDRITNLLAILLAVSLAFYIPYLLGFNLPWRHIEFMDGRYQSCNYTFFVTPLYTSLDSFRFKSIFLEPGYLNMGASMLIIANRFNMRKPAVVVLTVAMLMSLSLAAILILIVAYVGYLIIEGKKLTPIVVLVAIVLALGSYIYTLGPDNFLYETTIARLEYDPSTGTIAGNNRFTEEFDNYYAELCKTPKVWTGIGYILYSVQDFGANAGYKVYIIQFGIIGAMIWLIAYTLPLLFKRDRYIQLYTLCFIALLIPNSYPDMNCVIFNFILGIAYIEYHQEKRLCV